MSNEQDTDQGTDTMAHEPGANKGEEAASDQGKESGRRETGTDENDRPTGTHTSRDSTGINAEAEEPIDEKMPNMPPA